MRGGPATASSFREGSSRSTSGTHSGRPTGSFGSGRTPPRRWSRRSGSASARFRTFSGKNRPTNPTRSSARGSSPPTPTSPSTASSSCSSGREAFGDSLRTTLGGPKADSPVRNEIRGSARSGRTSGALPSRPLEGGARRSPPPSPSDSFACSRWSGTPCSTRSRGPARRWKSPRGGDGTRSGSSGTRTSLRPSDPGGGPSGGRPSLRGRQRWSRPVRDLLVDGEPQVLEGGRAELVHVQQEVVEIDPLRAVRGARLPGRVSRGRLVTGRMLLVLGPVVRSTDLPHEGRIDVADRVVRDVLRGDAAGRRCPGRRFRPAGGRDLPLEVRMDRTGRVLELADRATGDVLHDRLQVPTRAPSRRPVDRGFRVHAAPSGGVLINLPFEAHRPGPRRRAPRSRRGTRTRASRR